MLSVAAEPTSLQRAADQCGPLQVFLAPSRLGRAVVLSQKSGGLLGRDGVALVLATGHSLFVCEATGPESQWLTLAVNYMEYVR